MKRKCDYCGKIYDADKRNIKRGWGLCCSKRCAAKKRERSKPRYNPVRVAANNKRRRNWWDYYEDKRDYRFCFGNGENWDDPGDSEYWDNKDF